MLLYTLPIETIAEADMDEVERFAAGILPWETRRLGPLPLPDGAHDPERDQYHASVFMHEALKVLPADATRLLAVTERDLFIPMLTFIFGQAQVDGPLALLSLSRLRQEFYGLPPRRDLFLARARKEALHELGHTFGLFHCTDNRCAMALSVNIANIDIKQDRLCGDCAARVDDWIPTLGPTAGATED